MFILVSLADLCFGQTVLKYYGVHDIEPSQYSFLKNSLKGNFALIELPSDTLSWKNALSEAEKNGIKLIIWSEGHGHQWTPWAWNPSTGTWDISEGLNVLKFAEQYTSSGGKSLLALLMSHEPFYNDGHPFTAAQMKALYSTLKSFAPHVKLFVYMNDMAYYDKRLFTKIEDGIMDIAGIYRHWFGTQEGTMADALKEIDDDYSLIKQKGLNIQLFFALQTFATDGFAYRMPSASEMQNWGQLVLERNKLDGVFWYPWDRSSTDYTCWLSKDRYDSSGVDRWSVVARLSSYLSLTGVTERELQPTRFSLSQNFPNPFNPSTAISYQLAAVGFATLKVFDVLGREVATLVSGNRAAGVHTIRWDAPSMPSGVYFYRLQAGNFVETKKLLLAK
ncbi:T9SS C-terminal target domain-containing protein [bacterium]|nr:MAG: T9SS C-terminal target domain-containing protein [bacterium]